MKQTRKWMLLLCLLVMAAITFPAARAGAAVSAGTQTAAAAVDKTGVYKQADGKYHYYLKGVEQKNFTGFYTSAVNGKVFYIVKGVWASGTNAVVKRTTDNKWVYVKGGYFQKDFTGFYTSATNGKVFYIVKGVWASGTNAVIKRTTDNKWVYVKGGYFQKDFSGFYTSPTNGRVFYIVKGVWASGTNAVVKRTTDNKWVYVKGGYFQKDFSGFYTSASNGKVFYIQKGIWQSGTTALVKQTTDNKWVYVKGGYFQKDFSGIYTSAAGSAFYLEKGIWQSSYSGTKTYSGQVYTLAGGKVTKVAKPSPVTKGIAVLGDMKFYRGEKATVSIQGTPNVRYTITVYYKSGASEAAGLEPKYADAQGYVSWTWKVGANTTPGEWPIIIQGSNGERIEKYITVLRK